VATGPRDSGSRGPFTPDSGQVTSGYLNDFPYVRVEQTVCPAASGGSFNAVLASSSLPSSATSSLSFRDKFAAVLATSSLPLRPPHRYISYTIIRCFKCFISRCDSWRSCPPPCLGFAFIIIRPRRRSDYRRPAVRCGAAIRCRVFAADIRGHFITSCRIISYRLIPTGHNSRISFAVDIIIGYIPRTKPTLFPWLLHSVSYVIRSLAHPLAAVDSRRHRYTAVHMPTGN